MVSFEVFLQLQSSIPKHFDREIMFLPQLGQGGGLPLFNCFLLTIGLIKTQSDADEGVDGSKLHVSPFLVIVLCWSLCIGVSFERLSHDHHWEDCLDPSDFEASHELKPVHVIAQSEVKRTVDRVGNGPLDQRLRRKHHFIFAEGNSYTVVGL